MNSLSKSNHKIKIPQMYNKWHPSYHHIELPHRAHISLYFLSFISYFNQCCSVRRAQLFSTSLQHSRFSCPSPSPGACSTHVHSVGDAIQLSRPLSTTSPPALNLSQHQSFQQIFRVDFLKDWLIWSSCSPRDSQEPSPNYSWKASILQCSASFMVQLSYT